MDAVWAKPHTGQESEVSCVMAVIFYSSASVDGYLADIVARIKLSAVVWPSSKVIRASRRARLSWTCATPATLASACSSGTGYVSHFMADTKSTAVGVARRWVLHEDRLLISRTRVL